MTRTDDTWGNCTWHRLNMSWLSFIGLGLVVWVIGRQDKEGRVCFGTSFRSLLNVETRKYVSVTCERVSVNVCWEKRLKV